MVAARHLTMSDVIGVGGEAGWWAIAALFFKGSDMVDLDLIRVGDLAEYDPPFQYNWHVSSDCQVLRRGSRSERYSLPSADMVASHLNNGIRAL
jgi:hypothetical protein